MQCPRCGQENADGSKFCRHCGRKLPAIGGRQTARRPKKSAEASRTASPKGTRRRVRWFRVLGTTVLAVAAIGVLGLGYETIKALHNMPSVSNLVNLSTAGQDSVIYDRFDKPVATLHLSTNRVDVPLSQISPHVQDALVAIEDHNFWQNDGLDIKSIFRAAFDDLIHPGSLQGASTITEQLAKMLYLHDNRSISYKIRETILGLELARSYSRQQILDMYFNEVYLGDGAYGIETASKAYFNEKPSQLTIPQAALLAGLPQAPSAYDPLTDYQAAKARQLEVLQAMARYGYIKPSMVQTYYQAPLHLTPQKISTANVVTPYPYPYYIQHVIAVLESKGFTQQEIFDGGLKIHTELDPTVYTIAQNAVDHWMNYNFGPSPTYQAAAVVENPQTGAVWAVIGGRSQHFGGLNLATSGQVQRSSGSSIKPLLEYPEAIIQGYTQMSVVQDVPTIRLSNGTWWPNNDDNIYRGYIDLRDALGISDNDASVHLLEDVGVQQAYNLLTKGFGVHLPEVDTTQLGIGIGGFKAGGVNAYEMTQAYATFANQGVRMKPIWVSKVIDANGSVVYQDTPQGTRVLTPQQDYIMIKMMERVLDPNELPGIGPGAYTTGNLLGIGRPAGAKSGTNNGEADAWFLGYEPQMVVGVWEGNQYKEAPQPSTPNGLAYGATAAGPIWKQIMEQVNQAEHIPVKNFPRPSGLVQVNNVSITSGELAGPLTPHDDIANGIWFIQGTQPTHVGDVWELVRVLASNNHVLWEPGCGPYTAHVYLKPEPIWHAPEPLPWDHIFWPPTARCTPSASPSISPSTGPPSASPSTPPSTPPSTSPSTSPSTPPSSPPSTGPSAPSSTSTGNNPGPPTGAGGNGPPGNGNNNGNGTTGTSPSSGTAASTSSTGTSPSSGNSTNNGG